MKLIITLSLCLAMASATAPVFGQSNGPLQVVPGVDLARYAGRWFEIARLPNRFQKRCDGDVTAEYKLQPGGKIAVLNRCRLESGEYIEAGGVARVAGDTNAILKVRFAPAFLSFLPMVWGDYQIISLAEDYTHALVGAPSREYLWILSRTGVMAGATFERLVENARAQGFDVSLLEKTRHSASQAQP